MHEAAVRLSGVTKSVGATVAVKSLDLCVPRGGMWGFIGPNGAGKTTVIRMIMSILFPDRGAVDRGAGITTASALSPRRMRISWPSPRVIITA